MSKKCRACEMGDVGAHSRDCPKHPEYYEPLPEPKRAEPTNLREEIERELYLLSKAHWHTDDGTGSCPTCVVRRRQMSLLRRALEAMPEWRSIKNSPPKEGQRVLLRWRETGHIEDGDIRYNDNGDITHCLFDGERLNAEPTEWMPTPTDSAGN